MKVNILHFSDSTLRGKKTGHELMDDTGQGIVSCDMFSQTDLSLCGHDEVDGII